ncbi:hypothetical protein EDB84DRAFT_1680131 [Lactarius hengduanensis]|nr:hypothetical protein EDB84DRAFT_1680131 [Lactarius hengduanensis]
MYTLSNTLLPSASFPTPFHTSSLTHSAADETPEILSTFPSPSITPVPFSIPMSDFEYLPSATVDQPAPTLLSTPPAPSSISSTFLPSPARLETEDHPEPESASTPPIALSSLIHPLTHSPSSPSTDDVPEFAAAPTSSPSISSTFLSSPVRSEMNNQPESEHEAASTSMSVPLLSLPLSTLHPLSPLSSTFLPSPVTSATDDQPEHASTFSIPSSTSFHSASSLPSTSLLGSPITDNVPEIKPAPPSLSLCPSDLPVPTNLAPSPSTSNSQLCFPASSESTPASLSKPLELDDVKLESSPALAPSDVVTLSHPESSLLLLAQNEASVTVPTPRHSTPPQRPPGFKTVGSDCSSLEVTPAPASPTTPSVPQPREYPLVYYKVSQTFAPRLPLVSPSSTPSRSGLAYQVAYFNFVFVLITTAALVSTLFNTSTTLSTVAHKCWNKNKDFGNSQIGTLNTSSRDVFAEPFRLGRLTPRASRFVFDPGGPASSFKTTSGTRRHSTMQDDDTRRLQHARHQSSHSHSDRQSHRFRPRRWSVRVRAGTRGFGDA